MQLVAAILLVLSQVSLRSCRTRHSVSLLHDGGSSESELTLVAPDKVPTIAQLIPILEGLDPPETKISKLKELIPIYDELNRWRLNNKKRLVEIIPFKKKVKPLAFILPSSSYASKLKKPPGSDETVSKTNKNNEKIHKNSNNLHAEKHTNDKGSSTSNTQHNSHNTDLSRLKSHTSTHKIDTIDSHTASDHNQSESNAIGNNTSVIDEEEYLKDSSSTDSNESSSSSDVSESNDQSASNESESKSNESTTSESNTSQLDSSESGSNASDSNGSESDSNESDTSEFQSSEFNPGSNVLSLESSEASSESFLKSKEDNFMFGDAITDSLDSDPNETALESILSDIDLDSTKLETNTESSESSSTTDSVDSNEVSNKMYYDSEFNESFLKPRKYNPDSEPSVSESENIDAILSDAVLLDSETRSESNSNTSESTESKIDSRQSNPDSESLQDVEIRAQDGGSDEADEFTDTSFNGYDEIVEEPIGSLNKLSNIHDSQLNDDNTIDELETRRLINSFHGNYDDAGNISKNQDESEKDETRENDEFEDFNEIKLERLVDHINYGSKESDDSIDATIRNEKTPHFDQYNEKDDVIDKLSTIHKNHHHKHHGHDHNSADDTEVIVNQINDINEINKLEDDTNSKDNKLHEDNKYEAVIPNKNQEGIVLDDEIDDTLAATTRLANIQEIVDSPVSKFDEITDYKSDLDQSNDDNEFDNNDESSADESNDTDDSIDASQMIDKYYRNDQEDELIHANTHTRKNYGIDDRSKNDDDNDLYSNYNSNNNDFDDWLIDNKVSDADDSVPETKQIENNYYVNDNELKGGDEAVSDLSDIYNDVDDTKKSELSYNNEFATSSEDYKAFNNFNTEKDAGDTFTKENENQAIKQLSHKYDDKNDDNSNNKHTNYAWTSEINKYHTNNDDESNTDKKVFTRRINTDSEELNNETDKSELCRLLRMPEFRTGNTREKKKYILSFIFNR